MFPQLINELLAAGWTEAAIGRRIGRNQSTVNRMRRFNQRTDYSTGEALVALHAEVVLGRGAKLATAISERAEDGIYPATSPVST